MAGKKKSVAKAYVQVVPTVDGIKGALTKEFGGAVSSSFGDVFKGTLLSGALLGAAKEIGSAVLDIGWDAVNAAAEVKAANAQFSQTFGNLEGTATSALRSISKETGIAVTRLQGGYTALYAFTKSVGGDSDTALKIAQRAMKAAADSAAYYDRSVEDATETLQSFLKGNYENDAALGIAATETTRNAKANELYAKSFKELTEAQKVDVLLAMVEAGNKASGAMGQAAREADSWTNVTGELSEAWRQLLAHVGSPIMEGLTPIIQGVTEAINEFVTPTSWETLRASVAELDEAFRQADETLIVNMRQTEANASLAERYVDRLRELEAAGLDTDAAQREYAQTAELLNTLMPELNLTINETTGRLDQNTWAIEDNIASLKEQAQQQAKMQHYQTLLDAYSAAYESVYVAETRRNELLARQAELIEQGAVAYDHMSYAQSGSTHEMAEYVGSMSELDLELRAVLTELNGLNGEILVSSGALAEAEAELDVAAAAMGELAGATTGAAGAVDTLTGAYQEAKTAARESIDSQIGLFEELAEESEMSAEEIVANWEKQQQAFTQYGDNLKKAMELGLDETLIQQLSDGSQQSMLILDELVNGTELTIDEINAAFGGMSEARDTLAGTMAKMEAIANGTYDDMVAAAVAAGRSIMEGAAKGVRNNAHLLERAMGETANLGNKAYRMGWEINSPSRVMEDNSAYIIAGAVLGVENDTWKLEQAMEEMGERSIAAYNRNLVLDAAAYPIRIAGNAGFTGGGGVTNNHSYSLGGLSVSIYQQPGESADELVDRMIDKLSMMFDQGGAAIG